MGARTQTRSLELLDSPGSAALLVAHMRTWADELVATGEQSGRRLLAESEAQFVRMHAAQLERFHAPENVTGGAA